MCILNMGLVENTLTGNLILTVMLTFAEYERGVIVERTQTGKSYKQVEVMTGISKSTLIRERSTNTSN